MTAIASLDALLRLTLEDAEYQWEQIGQREPYINGRRQSDFTPVEVVLSHGASLLVGHRQFGGSTSNDAPDPVRLLASLFHRPPSSVLAKMANLDGSRPHGGRFDHAAGLVWTADRTRFDSV